MRYARIEAGVVFELIEPFTNEEGIEVPIEERFPPELVATMVPAHDEVQVGDGYREGQFGPPPAPATPPPPVVVTMRQARLALLDANLLDAVETALSGAPRAAQIEWEFAATVERSSPTVELLAGVLGLDDEALDVLFADAASR